MERRGVLAVVGAVALAVAVGVVQLGVPALPSRPSSVVYNLDSAFGDANNDLVWDPNFIPGFNGTPGVHINWSAPTGGPGTIDYYVGPWSGPDVAPYPHFAVGPQAFNFIEVPRTQVYRSPAWGDYHEVRQGFLPCAVNLGNVTVNASAAVHPVYVGLPVQGVAWTVEFPLAWQAPEYPTAAPASGEFALVATLALPPLPGVAGARLVYVNLVLWSSGPVAGGVAATPGAPTEGDAGAGTFVYDSLPAQAVLRNYSIDLSAYLGATLAGLGLDGTGALLSYVYLDAAGFNVRLQASFAQFELRGPPGLCTESAPAAGAN